MKYTTRQILRNAAFETLEDRRLCSTVTLADGVLTLIGDTNTPNRFNVGISQDGQSLSAYVTGSGEKKFSKAEVHKIKIVGGDKADTVFIAPVNIDADIRTGAGNDVIKSGSGNDYIDAGAGDDKVYGRGGNDQISGGEGNDALYGDKGDDKIDGGAGNDLVMAGEGNDSATGGTGNDALWGEAGNDALSGNDGVDAVHGGLGNDSLDGGANADVLTGDSGNDKLIGVYGLDQLLGGTGTNVIVAPAPEILQPIGPTDPAPSNPPVVSLPPVVIPTPIPLPPVVPPTPVINPTNDATAPTAVIHTIENSIMAGMAFHVHALDSTLGAGTELDAHFDWNFGDPSGKYNTLSGFNAAHVYETAGQYTITLTITNKSGKAATTTFSLNVAADTRRVIYVDPNGNDASTGLSPVDAVRTVARANQLITDNTEVLFKRGGTFDIPTLSDGFFISSDNVLIGAYGTGNAPVIRRTGTGNGGRIIDFGAEVTDFMVQDLQFASTVTTGTSQTNRPIVLTARGTNISIRNCSVDNIGYMVTTTAHPQGVLVQDNTSPSATGLSGYMVWLETNDVVILGNKIANSTREHIVRSSSESTQRVLIAHNDFTNLDRTAVDSGDQIKTTINIRAGSHIYIAHNKLNDGLLELSTTILMDASMKAQWLVVDNNEIHNSFLRIGPNVWDVMIRNNHFDRVGGEQINITPSRVEQPGRTIKDINIINNTGVNMTDTGKFLKILTQAPAGSITVMNNLFYAPNLKYGAAIDINATDLTGFATISHNVWSTGLTDVKPVIVNGASMKLADWEATDQVVEDVYMQIGNWNGSNVTLPTFTAGALAA